jgi:hypothetical protein
MRFGVGLILGTFAYHYSGFSGELICSPLERLGQISRQSRASSSHAQSQILKEGSRVAFPPYARALNLALPNVGVANIQNRARNQALYFLNRSRGLMQANPAEAHIYDSFMRAAEDGRISIIEGSPARIIYKWANLQNASSLDVAKARNDILGWYQRELAKNNKSRFEREVVEGVLRAASDAKLRSAAQPSQKLIEVLSHYARAQHDVIAGSAVSGIGARNQIRMATELLKLHVRGGGNTDAKTLRSVVGKAYDLSRTESFKSKMDLSDSFDFAKERDFAPTAFSIQQAAKQDYANRLSGMDIGAYNSRGGKTISVVSHNPETGVVELRYDVSLRDRAISNERGAPMLTRGVVTDAEVYRRNMLRPLPSANGKGFWVIYDTSEGYKRKPPFGSLAPVALPGAYTRVRVFQDEKTAWHFCMEERKHNTGFLVGGQNGLFTPL